jgi:hypothetical protein
MSHIVMSLHTSLPRQRIVWLTYQDAVSISGDERAHRAGQLPACSRRGLLPLIVEAELNGVIGTRCWLQCDPTYPL